MTNASLSPSGYVVLGLIATCGPMTPYELKKVVDESIGYFWSFPRAQLYVEPERLTALGLLDEAREAEGRRRRTYRITEAGRAKLHEWLMSDIGAPVELRDPGLLKLFFGQELSREEVVALAHAQEATHRARLAEYEALAQRLAGIPGTDFGRATLAMGLRYEQESVAFWDGIAANPPADQSVTTESTEDTEDAEGRDGQNGGDAEASRE